MSLNLGSGSASTVAAREEVSQSANSWLSLLSSKIEELQNISAASDAAAIHEARRKLDCELEGLIQTVRAVRMRRNTLSPVHRLPPEILAMIFSFLADEYPPRRFVSYGLSKLGWITVTHVCHHWRQVALDNPSLWGRDVCSHTNCSLVEERLARSKQSLLSIGSFYSADAVEWMPLMRTVFEEMHRIQDLSLTGEQEYLTNLLIEHFSKPAPFLHTLRVTTSWGYIQTPLAPVVSLPTNLFSGNAPRLRELVLVNCTTPWQPWIFTNLVHLEVTIAEYASRRGLPTPEHLLSLLDVMTYLKFLKLVNVLPAEDGASLEESSMDHIITLPSTLHTFHLAGEARPNSWFMQRLVIPPLAHVYIELTSPDPDVETCHLSLPSLARHIATYAEPLKSISVDGRGSFFLILKAWTFVLADKEFRDQDAIFPALVESSPPPDQDPIVTIVFRWQSQKSNIDVLSQTLQTLPVDEVQALFVKDSPHETQFTVAAWTNTLGRLRAVRSVSVHDNGAWDFFKALILPEPSQSGLLDPKLLFPDLRHITMRHVNFRAYVYDAQVSVADGMQGVLMQRLPENYGLELLEIHRSRIEMEDIKKLEELVPFVEWDGESSVFPSETDTDDEVADLHDVFGHDLFYDDFDDGWNEGVFFEDHDEYDGMEEMFFF
ncbi:hypothetical protein BV25DRAFT_1885251 [Artomyces pyxidatus]|uniref:Uncharacterized protein n=1 Tax=Artomyces pyxidatus TaxID=48021 RepID=A0ACB8T349_9AGAM|nr:hypothetical protein BV25DRAFT_1885251 [Artomyces pyxidatus]